MYGLPLVDMKPRGYLPAPKINQMPCDFQTIEQLATGGRVTISRVRYTPALVRVLLVALIISDHTGSSRQVVDDPMDTVLICHFLTELLKFFLGVLFLAQNLAGLRLPHVQLVVGVLNVFAAQNFTCRKVECAQDASWGPCYPGFPQTV